MNQKIYPSEMKMQQGASERRVEPPQPSAMAAQRREAHTQATSNDAASSFPMGIISIDIDEYSYTPDEIILKNIHLKLHAGSLTSVLGPSGSGKSTLLRLLMGFENTKLGASQNEHSFSLVPQTSYLFPWKTIFENIVLNIDDSKGKITKSDLSSKVSKILKIVGLSGIENKYPFEISVGMSQRVSFARAMINSFQVLLLDEPFSSLDALTRLELQNWLLKIIKEQNSYGLFVTHDISEAIYLSQNIYIFSQKPAQVIAHFLKNDDSFIETNTGKVFGPENMRELENAIFSLL